MPGSRRRGGARARVGFARGPHARPRSRQRRARARPEALAARLAEIAPEAADRPEDVRVVHAPGRVNLIGEHTDYNLGFVLPVAIDLGISVALVPNDEGVVRLTLAETGETATFAVDDPGPKRGHWSDYVAGIAWAMGEAGLGPRGFDGLLASDLPQGAGLSSSAAISVVSSWALAGGDAPPWSR